MCTSSGDGAARPQQHVVFADSNYLAYPSEWSDHSNTIYMGRLVVTETIWFALALHPIAAVYFRCPHSYGMKSEHYV